MLHLRLTPLIAMALLPIAACAEPPRSADPTPTTGPTPSPATTSARATQSPDESGALLRFDTPAGDVVIRLVDNPTTRDLVSLLPLTAEFEDFRGTEKISYLPRELTTDGSPGSAPEAGDLIYYAPWGNLGLFYTGGAEHSDQTIPLGSLESGGEYVDDLERAPVTIERVS
jgi:hypothetical protein